jgi:hypothetical protein
VCLHRIWNNITIAFWILFPQKEFLQWIIKVWNGFSNYGFKVIQKVLIPCEILNPDKQTLFYFFFTFQIFGMWQTTTLKRNLVPRFGEARKKYGFGILGVLPPLKETFVGILGLGFRRGTPWFWLGTGSSLYHMLLLPSFPIGGCHLTYYSIHSSSRWLEYSFPPL